MSSVDSDHCVHPALPTINTIMIAIIVINDHDRNPDDQDRNHSNDHHRNPSNDHHRNHSNDRHRNPDHQVMGVVGAGIARGWVDTITNHKIIIDDEI